MKRYFEPHERINVDKSVMFIIDKILSCALQLKSILLKYVISDIIAIIQDISNLILDHVYEPWPYDETPIIRLLTLYSSRIYKVITVTKFTVYCIHAQPEINTVL